MSDGTWYSVFSTEEQFRVDTDLPDKVRNVLHLKAGETFTPKNNNYVVLSCWDAVDAEMVEKELIAYIKLIRSKNVKGLNAELHDNPDLRPDLREDFKTKRDKAIDTLCILEGIETEEEIDEARRKG